MGQSGPGSRSILHSNRGPELKLHYQMQFSVISKILGGGGGLRSVEIQSMYSTVPTDRAVAVKEYSTFPKVSELQPHHQMQFNVIPRMLVSGAGG